MCTENFHFFLEKSDKLWQVSGGLIAHLAPQNTLPAKWPPKPPFKQQSSFAKGFGIGSGSHLETYRFQIGFVMLISSSICILVTKKIKVTTQLFNILQLSRNVQAFAKLNIFNMV